LIREIQTRAEVAIIVCGSAECPVVYARHVEECSIPDPTKMSLDDARKVRDTIKEKVLNLIERSTSKRFE